MPRRRPTPPHGAPLPLDVDAHGRNPGTFVVDDSAAMAAFRAAATQVEQRYAAEADDWATSPFRWLKHLPTASRAKAAEGIITVLLSTAGFRVGPRIDASHECTVESMPVRVKFSTLWSSGRYTFQQLPKDDSGPVLLLGVSPYEPHAWIVAAPALRAAAGAEPWLAVDPRDPPAAMAGLGGPLPMFLDAVAKTVGPPSGVAMGPFVAPDTQ